MSWTEDFNGTLDPAKFGTSVAGDGAVAVSGGTLNITMGAAAGNAGIVYLKAAIVSYSNYSFALRQKIDGTISGFIPLFDLHNGTPVVSDNGTVNPALRVYCQYNGGLLYVMYRDAGGTLQYWNQSTQTWQAAAAASVSIIVSSYIDICFIVFNGKFNFDIRVGGNTQSIIQSTPVAFTDLNAYTTLYAFWGEIYNNFYYATSMKTEFVKYQDAAVVYGFYNGQAAAGYKCGRVISFDGGDSFFQNPTTPILSPATGESDVKDINILLDTATGTLHILYAALRNQAPYSSKWRIRYCTSVDYGITLVDHGYITTPGGTGSWNEMGDTFPCPCKIGATWHVYTAGGDILDTRTVGHYSGTDLTALSASGSNPVIVNGSAGSWNEGGSIASDMTYINGIITLFVGGLKASTSRWQNGIYTSSDWITFTPDAGNPVMVRDATRSQALTANTTTNVTTQLTVADSSKLTAGEPVFIYHAAGSFVQETNRVLSIPDGTHINLSYPVKNSYLTANAAAVYAYNAGSVFWGESNALRSLVTSFQMYASGASGLFIETTSFWDYAAGAWILNKEKSPPLPIGPSWNTISCENLRLVGSAIAVLGGYSALQRLRRVRRAA